MIVFQLQGCWELKVHGSKVSSRRFCGHLHGCCHGVLGSRGAWQRQACISHCLATTLLRGARVRFWSWLATCVRTSFVKECFHGQPWLTGVARSVMPSGRFLQDYHLKRITPRHLQIAIRGDEELAGFVKASKGGPGLLDDFPVYMPHAHMLDALCWQRHVRCRLWP